MKQNIGYGVLGGGYHLPREFKVLSGVRAQQLQQLVQKLSEKARQTSHVTRHKSHVTRHKSHVTRHTSHVTRHTSHVTLHLQPSKLACVPSKIDTHAGVRVGGISDQSVTVNYCVNGISAWANTSRAALSSSCWWWWSWGGGRWSWRGGSGGERGTCESIQLLQQAQTLPDLHLQTGKRDSVTW